MPKKQKEIKMPALKAGVEITLPIRILANILRPLVRFLYKVEVTGKENLPKSPFGVEKIKRPPTLRETVKKIQAKISTIVRAKKPRQVFKHA